MYMVINMKKKLKKLFNITIFSLAFSISANDVIEIRVASDTNSLDLIKISDTSQVKKIFLNKIYNDKKTILNESQRENSNNNLSSQTLNNQFVLAKNEFVQIQGADGIKKLFNGSIIIKFQSVPDLQNYAINNELELVSDLRNIQRGVFKINNLYELQSIIDDIESDVNVLEVELQTFDTRIQSE